MCKVQTIMMDGRKLKSAFTDEGIKAILLFCFYI